MSAWLGRLLQHLRAAILVLLGGENWGSRKSSNKPCNTSSFEIFVGTRFFLSTTQWNTSLLFWNYGVSTTRVIFHQADISYYHIYRISRLVAQPAFILGCAAWFVVFCNCIAAHKADTSRYEIRIGVVCLSKLQLCWLMHPRQVKLHKLHVSTKKKSSVLSLRQIVRYRCSYCLYCVPTK